jgi:hypothetical protein
MAPARPEAPSEPCIRLWMSKYAPHRWARCIIRIIRLRHGSDKASVTRAVICSGSRPVSSSGPTRGFGLGRRRSALRGFTGPPPFLRTEASAAGAPHRDRLSDPCHSIRMGMLLVLGRESGPAPCRWRLESQYPARAGYPPWSGATSRGALASLPGSEV